MSGIESPAADPGSKASRLAAPNGARKSAWMASTSLWVPSEPQPTQRPRTQPEHGCFTASSPPRAANAHEPTASSPKRSADAPNRGAGRPGADVAEVGSPLFVVPAK